MQITHSEFAVQFQRMDQVDGAVWHHGQTCHNEARAIEVSRGYFELHRAVRVVQISHKTLYARWK